MFVFVFVCVRLSSLSRADGSVIRVNLCFMMIVANERKFLLRGALVCICVEAVAFPK